MVNVIPIWSKLFLWYLAVAVRGNCPVWSIMHSRCFPEQVIITFAKG